MLTTDSDIEVIVHDNDLPLIGKYIDVFLRNQRTAEIESDNRGLFYRGQSDINYLLMPSVFRNGLLTKEHILIQQLLLKSPDDFNNNDNDIERLIKMQHYGLPTRLLDVTTNPLVALFFACNENADKDGEIIVFYDYMEHPNAIYARCLVALSEYASDSERDIISLFTVKGIMNVNLGELSKRAYILIEVPRNNERIRRQHGAFVVVGLHGREYGNPFQKEKFDLKPLLVRDFDDGVERSIVIPKDEKAQLLKELDVLGINRAFLFPELEHQAAHIRDKYVEI